MNQISLPLCIGNPEDYSEINRENKNEFRGATFSRFVLPFSYNIEKILDPNVSSMQAELNYRVTSGDSSSFAQRKKYFTHETALTLYERALWLEMSDKWSDTDWAHEKITISLRNKEFKIGMLPPRIVLFEALKTKRNVKDENKNRLGILSDNDANILNSGFLFVDLYFPEQTEVPQLDDLLEFNEHFRYFERPYKSHEKDFGKIFKNVPIDYTDNGATKTIKDMDEFERYFERWANLLDIPLEQDNQFFRLFPEEWAKNARAVSNDNRQTDPNKNWQIYADNRTYVWTAAFLKNGSETLKNQFASNSTAEFEPKNYGHWLKLLNVDKPGFDVNKTAYSPQDTHEDISEFEKNWLDQRTYKRWKHVGTLYGYSYHSGAMLTTKTSNFPSYEVYGGHYFDTTLLLFYIRISLFRFSKELTDIFQYEQGKECREKLMELRKRFSAFTALYQFPQVSNQQQSIEMYKLNRRYFSIDKFFNEIQQEINNSHDFLESTQANELNTAANRLAKFGIPLAVGALISGIFGMNDFNIFDCAGECDASLDIIAEVGIVLVITFGILACFLLFSGGKK